MKELLRKRIAELTALIGVSGDEWDVAKYIKEALEGRVDSLEVTNSGMVIARKRGARPGPRVMIAAHMDEVGFSIRAVSADGFLYFDKIGGLTEACIPGRRVLVKGKNGVIPGIIGVRAGHMLTPEQRAKPQTVQQSYIDVCATSREEVLAMGISTGCSAVPDSPCAPMRDPDYLMMRAADCRVLCAVLIEALLRLSPADFSGEVCAVFTPLEETATQLAAPAVARLKPDYALFLDTVPCGDVPDCDFERELPIALRGGPVIILSQKSGSLLHVVSHPRLIEALRDGAARAGVPHQEFAFVGASYVTDAAAAIHGGEGTAVAALACPRRYSHSPSELIHLDDVVAELALVEEFLKTPVDLRMF